MRLVMLTKGNPKIQYGNCFRKLNWDYFFLLNQAHKMQKQKRLTCRSRKPCAPCLQPRPRRRHGRKSKRNWKRGSCSSEQVPIHNLKAKKDPVQISSDPHTDLYPLRSFCFAPRNSQELWRLQQEMLKAGSKADVMEAWIFFCQF